MPWSSPLSAVDPSYLGADDSPRHLEHRIRRAANHSRVDDEKLIARTTTQRRLALILFAAFAIAALLLAVAGIYGVLAGNVAERTRREIGLRAALGASPREIMALVLGQGARLGVLGLLIGFSAGERSPGICGRFSTASSRPIRRR